MLCLFALSMVLSAWALPPDEKKVTLDLKDVPMETFLNTVKQKAGINMLYNSQMFKGVEPVTVKAANESWKELLDRVLSPKGFTYATKDGIVVIKKKDQKTRTLEGKVVDEQGGELPGVTVLILGKERNIGTMTDADGAFSLGLPEGDVTIRLSFVGMQTLEIHTGKLNLDKVHTFKLKPDSKQLEEVVVTGYAKISKNSFTGTSVTVTADQLMSVSKTNVLGALQTFDPSFRIAENNLAGSNPNNVPELYIRGRSGIGTTQLDAQSLSKTSLKNNPNLPTFIMDGFEISVQKLYDMDPSRIESITILKDAAATAMYGSRAANGVVIITTVTPKQGKVNIDYNFTGTLEYPDLTDYNLMNAREKLETEVAAGMFTAKPEDGASEQNRLDVLYNQKLNNVVRGVDTYWLSKPLRTVFNHKHSLYLDGHLHRAALRRFQCLLHGVVVLGGRAADADDPVPQTQPGSLGRVFRPGGGVYIRKSHHEGAFREHLDPEGRSAHGHRRALGDHRTDGAHRQPAAQRQRDLITSHRPGAGHVAASPPPQGLHPGKARQLQRLPGLQTDLPRQSMPQPAQRRRSRHQQVDKPHPHKAHQPRSVHTQSSPFLKECLL